MQQPASSYSRGYRGRGFSRDLFPPPSGPRGFFRPKVRPPQLYSSERRIHQESPAFPQPYRKENPMTPQYSFPPPVFGSVSDGHQFHPPPSNMNMMWTGPNMYNSSYTFLPPPPPPPPDSHPPSVQALLSLRTCPCRALQFTGRKSRLPRLHSLILEMLSFTAAVDQMQSFVLCGTSTENDSFSTYIFCFQKEIHMIKVTEY